MPYTLNGIGTHYYGRSNERSRTGTCARCGKESRLASYDTRYFFCVLYIPLLPLGRRHIVDSCFFCTAHRALKHGEWEKLRVSALEEAMKRVKDEPASADALINLHQACCFFAEYEKADALQIRMEEEFARDARVHLYLASAWNDRGFEADALRFLKRAKEIDPTLAEVPPPPKPVRVVASRRQRVLLGVLAVLVVGIFSAVSVGKKYGRTLHVVNGFDAPVTVELAGDSFPVAPHTRLERTLSEGRHVARVRGPLEEEIPFAIESNFFARLFDDRTFILNPGGEALLLHETAVYTSRPGGGPVTSRLVYGKPFVELDDLDYAFEPFPSSIQVKGNVDKKKKRVDLYQGDAEDAVNALVALGRRSEALALAEWALRARPRPDSELATFYATQAPNSPFLKELLAKRPVDVAAHRAYQNQNLSAEKAPALAAEYEALLKAEPEDSALLYLKARTTRRNSEARPYLDRALKADPKNAWAHNAVAHGLAADGDWEGARSAIEKACALRPGYAPFLDFHRRCRFALRDFDALEQELRAESARDFLLLSLHEFLVQVLAAAGKKDAAKEVGREYVDRLQGRREADAPGAIVQLRGALAYALEDFEGLAQLGPEQKRQALLEQGRADEAEKDLKDPDAFTVLALAIVKKGEAAAMDRAAAALEKGSPEMAAGARALRSGKAEDLEAALDSGLDAHWKAPLLVALAFRYPDRAVDLHAKARRLNVLPVFPHHLVRRAIR